MSRNLESKLKYHIIVSDIVDYNLKLNNLDIDLFCKYDVINYYGISGLFKSKKFLNNPNNKLFVFFGPLYTLKINCFCIMGFAQPWIIYPNNDLQIHFNWFNKILTKVKYKIQKYFYAKANLFVVEHLHVKNRLSKLVEFKNKKVVIVHNTISNIFLQENIWQGIEHINFNSNDLNIGYLGKNYPHKNLNILPEVKKILESNYEINANFYVTFDDNDWNKCSDIFKKEIINLGNLNLVQCPTFYNKMDMIIFPSLLECFSATPIESLFMEKPLFASNRPYIADICKNFAYYFNPLDPFDIAKVICDFLRNGKDHKLYKVQAKKFIIENYNTANRTKLYLELLKNN